MGHLHARLAAQSGGQVERRKDGHLSYSEIIVHHTASADTDAVELDAVRDWHVQGRGWSDVGYHWLVEGIDGRYRAIMGRPMPRPGAHARGHNLTAVGVAFLGDFSLAPPDIDMVEVGADLVAGLVALAGRLILIRPHRAVAETLCPGDAFPFGALMDGVSARLSGREGAEAISLPDD